MSETAPASVLECIEPRNTAGWTPHVVPAAAPEIDETIRNLPSVTVVIPYLDSGVHQPERVVV